MTSCIKYSEQGQFDKIMVYDRNDGMSDKLYPLSHYKYLSVPQYCYDYEVMFFVKEDELLEEAKFAWAKFKSKHYDEVCQGLEN